jgi:hypothetical protein
MPRVVWKRVRGYSSRGGGGITRNGGERKTQEGRSAAGAAVGVAEEEIRSERPTGLQWLLFLNGLDTLREIGDLNQ